MINTDTKTKVSNSIVPLHLYSFDAQKLINKFHDQIVKEINESKNKDFKAQMAISRDFNCLYINAWWDRDATGLRPTKLIKRDNRSDSEFATYILQGYMDYLQRERKKQSKMDFEEIYDLLTSNKCQALFSAKDYIDWIINNLNKIQSSYGICFDYMFTIKQNHNRTNEDYFFKRLIVQLTQCNKINSCIISQIMQFITDNMSYDNIQQDNPQIFIKLLALSSQLQSFIENSAILHQKFTNLAEMDYSSLLEFFELTNITTVQAPLASILDYKSYINLNVKFYLTNKDDLQEFINAFIISEDDWSFSDLTTIFAKQKITVYFKDYQNVINNQIKAIHNNFNHTQRLKDLANILLLLLKYITYEELPQFN